MKTGVARSAWWILTTIGLAAASVPGRAGAFTASFSWAGIPTCAKISPAFQMSGVPAGTRHLRFHMTDLDFPVFHHGGSTIAYRGDHVKRGAVNYVGPCPPGGQHHRYLWTIDALGAQDKVLGTAKVTRTFPHESRR